MKLPLAFFGAVIIGAYLGFTGLPFWLIVVLCGGWGLIVEVIYRDAHVD